MGNERKAIKIGVPVLVVVGFVATLVALAFSLSLGAGKALASPLNVDSLKGTVGVSILGKETRYYAAPNASKTITNAKSNKKKIVAVKTEGNKALKVTFKKKGTAKVTFKLNGKKKTVKFKVYAYKNPFAKIEFGGADLTAQFNNSRRCDVEYGEKVLNITPAKNWKIVNISGLGENGYQSYQNGAAVNHPRIIMKNTKTKVEEWIYLDPRL